MAYGSYAQVELLLRDLQEAVDDMVARDPRLIGLGSDVLGEVRQLEFDVAGAKDESLSDLDRALLQDAVDGLRPLLLQLQVETVPPDRAGVGADQSYNVLAPYRRHVRNLQEVLRRDG